MKYLKASDYSFYFYILPLCIFLSCTGTDTPASESNCNFVHLSPKDLTEGNSKKVLFLIADDRSGSTRSSTQPARITEEQYKSLLNVFIEKNFSGQFDLRVIGNNPHTGFEQILTIEALYITKNIPKDAILSDKSRMRCINERIIDTSKQIKNNNQDKINKYISDIVLPKAINYVPAGVDNTDIASAFRDIEMKINSCSKMGFDKIIVVIMCDGNDSNNSPNLTIRADLPFEIITIGWPESKKIIEGEVKRFGSADELINWYKNTKL